MARKKSSLGFLFWIAFILLVLVVFLFNKTRIDTVMESTGFLTVIQKKFGNEEGVEVQRKTMNQEEGEHTSAEGDAGDPGQQENSDSDAVLTVEPGPSGTAGSAEQNTPPEPSSRSVPEPASASETETADRPYADVRSAENDGDPKEQITVAARPQPEKRLMRKSRIYYTFVDDEGRISIRSVIRPVYYTDSPLTATVASLLHGPTPEELNAGLLTLIPQDTRLLSAYIKGNTVFLNFNEEFRFNTLGIDGYVAQLKQIVYTVTEFQNVDSVQFLVQGKKLDYLTAEGIYIGAPLSRSGL